MVSSSAGRARPPRRPDLPPRRAASPPTAAAQQRSGPRATERALASTIGNRAFASLVAATPAGAGVVQRVPVSYADTGETLYEDPDPAAGQTQFQATAYGGGTIAYDMARDPSGVTVTVRILFVNQARDERRTLPGGAPNPNFGADTGAQTAVPANDPRRQFAVDRCGTIGTTWNRYDLVGRRIAPPTPGAPGATGPSGAPGAPGAAPTGPTPAPAAGTTPAATPAPAPAIGPPAPPAADPSELKLPIRFVAQPVFDLSAAGTTHSTVSLFGMGTHADRSGAHPVDSGHWYMNTARNYAGMDLDAIYAHEYGHLIGLQDEYFRSNDQIHQSLHRMGGAARGSGQELDRQTVRRMVSIALRDALTPRLQASVGEISAAFVAKRAELRAQLAAAVRSTWADAGLRGGLAKQLHDEVPAGLRGELDAIVAFQTGANLSNVAVAGEAMGGFSTDAIERAVVGGFWRRFERGDIGVTAGDGTATSISMEVSSNVSGAASAGGTSAAAGTAVADRVVGAATASGIPPVRPSSTLLGALAAIPAQWSSPGQGLDAAYTPGVVSPSLDAAVASAVTAGAFRRIDRQALYRRVLSLVNSTVRASSRTAVTGFIDAAVRPQLDAQVGGLQSQIDAEVDAVMGLPAGAVASSAPRDPQVQAVAQQMHTLLQGQQNPSQRTAAADINPGSGGAGQDVRYSMSTMMGTNVTSPEGFRADMLQPVVDQFNGNAALRDPAAEEPFRAARR